MILQKRYEKLSHKDRMNLGYPLKKKTTYIQ